MLIVTKDLKTGILQNSFVFSCDCFFIAINSKKKLFIWKKSRKFSKKKEKASLTVRKAEIKSNSNSNLPIRPTVASTKSPTSALSKWLASLCKPLILTQISYIKNSSKLVKKLKEVEISSNSIISSLDIE